MVWSLLLNLKFNELSHRFRFICSLLSFFFFLNDDRETALQLWWLKVHITIITGLLQLKQRWLHEWKSCVLKRSSTAESLRYSSQVWLYSFQWTAFNIAPMNKNIKCKIRKTEHPFNPASLSCLNGPRLSLRLQTPWKHDVFLNLLKDTLSHVICPESCEIKV